MKKVLIIKLDAIGDYFLSRQSMKSFAYSPLFDQCEFYLLGNCQWQELAENLDNHLFTQMFFINPKEFTSVDAVQNVYAQINIFFDIVFCPVRSRTQLADLFVALSSAPLKITPLGNSVNQPENEANTTFYSMLIPEKDPYGFEVDCLKDICLNLQIPSDKIPPYQEAFPAKYISHHELNRGIAFFIGASHKGKKWSITNWASLINSLQNYINCPFILLGGSECIEEAEEIENVLQKEIVNLVGKTTLLEMAGIISQAQLLITHDSVAVHMAATFGTKHICLASGTYWQRFIPYPQHIAEHSYVFYPEEFEAMEEKNSQELYLSPFTYSMNQILAEKVAEKALEILSPHLNSALTQKYNFELAPLVLICFKRLEHVKKVMEALTENTIAHLCELHVFIDGGRNPEEALAVQAVNDYMHFIAKQNFFKSVYITQRSENLGCAKNVILAQKAIFEKYSRIIYLEEDIMPNKYFLEYMQEALEYHKDDTLAWHIVGGAFTETHMDYNKEYPYDTYYALSECYGFATWKHNWELVDFELKDIQKFTEDFFAVKAFSLISRFAINTLDDQINHRCDTWDVHWAYAQIKHGKFNILPTKALAVNIGNDAEGLHCKEGANPQFETQLIQWRPENFVKKYQLDFSLILKGYLATSWYTAEEQKRLMLLSPYAWQLLPENTQQ